VVVCGEIQFVSSQPYGASYHDQTCSAFVNLHLPAAAAVPYLAFAGAVSGHTGEVATRGATTGRFALASYPEIWDRDYIPLDTTCDATAKKFRGGEAVRTALVTITAHKAITFGDRFRLADGAVIEVDGKGLLEGKKYTVSNQTLTLRPGPVKRLPKA